MRVPETLVRDIATGHTACFVGAGLSRGAGLPDWKQLTEKIARDVELPANIGVNEYLAVADLYEQQNGRPPLIDILRTETSTINIGPTENHRRLTRLGIGTWITTNYDNLLERTLAEAGIGFTVVLNDKQLTFAGREQAVIAKLHGDLSAPEYIVLSGKDYKTVQRSRPYVWQWMSLQLIQNSVLFVGYSASDPDLQLLIRDIRRRLKDQHRRSYIALRNASPQTRKELDQLNISVVDLPQSEDLDSSGSLAAFLDSLQKAVATEISKRRQDAAPTESTLRSAAFPKSNSAIDNKIKEIIHWLDGHADAWIVGPPGSGKRTLAAQVAERMLSTKRIRYVLSTTLGSPSTYRRTLLEWCAQLGVLHDPLEDQETVAMPWAEHLLRRIASAISTEPLLVTIHDVPDSGPLSAYRIPAPNVKYLITSTSEGIAQAFTPTTMTKPDALKLLKQRIPALYDQAEEVLGARVEEILPAPFAVDLLAALAEDVALNDSGIAPANAVRDALNAPIVDPPEGTARSDEVLDALMRKIWSRLDDSQRRGLGILTLFPPGPDSLTTTAVEALIDSRDLSRLKRLRLLLDSNGSRAGLQRFSHRFVHEHHHAGDQNAVVSYFSELLRDLTSRPMETADLYQAIDDEIDEISIALECAYQISSGDLGVQMCEMLWGYWYARSKFSDVYFWASRFLTLKENEVSRAKRAAALDLQGKALFNLGSDYLSAEAALSTALKARRELKDEAGCAQSLNNLALVVRERGDWTTSHELLAEALRLNDGVRPLWYAVNLENLGRVAHLAGESALAREFLYRSLVEFVAERSSWGAGMAMRDFAELELADGRLVRSRNYAWRSVQIAREFENYREEAQAALTIARACERQGDVLSAYAWASRSLKCWQLSGSTHGIADVADFVALLQLRSRKRLMAVRLHSAAQEIRHRIGAYQPRTQEVFERLRAEDLKLSPASLARARMQGRRMPISTLVKQLTLATEGRPHVSDSNR